MEVNPDNLLENTLLLLSKSKITEYKRVEDSIIAFSNVVLPKKTKSLSINFIKRTYEVKDELSLVLIGHLYIEKFLDEILKNKLKNYDRLKSTAVLNTFYKKIIFLKSEELLSEEASNNILIINQIRNKFAHKLNYNLNEFDFYQFSFMKSYKSGFKVKSAKNVKILYRIILRVLFFSLLDSLSNEYRFLHLLNEE